MVVPIQHKESSNILLAGAGGGFDFLCALPIALKLLSEGHTVSFASYSFSNLKKCSSSEWLDDNILVVDENSYTENGEYFPELYLPRWFSYKMGLKIPVFCFSRLGIRSLRAAYNKLHEIYRYDALYVVDGGADGIFRGDEYGLGTPSMDSISVIAGSTSAIPNCTYVLTAFGSEGINNEVAHADVLERVSELTSRNYFYGVSALLKSSQVGSDFMNAVDFIFNKMDIKHRSVIVSSIVKSMEGMFGNNVVNLKTVDRPVWLSPLTNLFWFFNLDGVARLKLFYSDVLETDSVAEVSDIITHLHEKIGKKNRDSIPI